MFKLCSLTTTNKDLILQRWPHIKSFSPSGWSTCGSEVPAPKVSSLNIFVLRSEQKTFLVARWRSDSESFVTKDVRSWCWSSWLGPIKRLWMLKHRNDLWGFFVLFLHQILDGLVSGQRKESPLTQKIPILETMNEIFAIFWSSKVKIFWQFF